MTSGQTRPDSATLAAIAQGWIEDNIPAQLCLDLFDMVDQWRERGTLPLGLLWRPIVERLRYCGCFDAEIEACRLVLSLEPGLAPFRLRLAEVLVLTGHDPEARDILLALDGPPPIRREAWFLRLELGGEAPEVEAALLSGLEEMLAADGAWGPRHRDLVSHLVRVGGDERGGAFLDRWLEGREVPADLLFEMGVMAMTVGRPQAARVWFAPLWHDLSEGDDPVLGRFDGAVRPYDAAIEAALVSRIEQAFALDEDELACLTHPGPEVLPDLRVLLVTIGHASLPNDVAEQFAGSAAVAGVHLDIHFDTALLRPTLFRGGDDEVRRRVEAFIARLERERPDVVVVDCAAPLILRGLNPATLADLKRRLGFRLACVARDAHLSTLPLLDAWLPACDTMITFDPLSPLLRPAPGRQCEKVLPLPVPSLHGHFLDRRERDLGLTFVGGCSWEMRHMVLAVLMTEDVGFSALYGHRRRLETPDTAAYAEVLTRSRAVLNVSRHTREEHLVTGRVWEAIAAGAVLLEQDNPATAAFLTPWRHYLPWSNPEDAVHMAHFINRRPDLAARIAAEGHAWMRRHYGGRQFWAALLGHVTRPRTEAELLSDHVAAQDWIGIAMIESEESRSCL
ncbi:glycosyltransferase family protein [Paramagnetospirillum marisnigri]|uniref:glycosyltransferase family protein n=1 Tax=Paramagnetospirillum marisnigri TaxID=1285242 RepID=UPI0012E956BB|nr:glycosyltransferase [Paramagnetospirillum marisnigri]